MPALFPWLDCFPVRLFFRLEDPPVSANHPVFLVDFKCMSPNQTPLRGARADPITSDLKAGARNLAAFRDFRTVGADGSLGAPLATRSYEVWAVAALPTLGNGKRDWRMFVRPGPNAIGEGLIGAQFVKRAPPAPPPKLSP